MSKFNAEEVKKQKDGYDVLADIYRYSEQGTYEGIEQSDLEIRFKWFGLYRQKPNTGHFMIRLRIAGGQLTPHQLREISKLSGQYARGFGDITTRMTIQFHWLTIKDLGPLFKKLDELGLCSTFACGDVPRNVISCPLAGVIKDEIIDPTPALKAMDNLFLKGGKEYSNLPRKYKTGIGGCSLHCHQPQINCMAYFGAKSKSGEVGYGLTVGGGLSDTPHFGQGMRVFVKPEQIADVTHAVTVMYRDHGYREKRNRSRLKFLVADKGWEWTRDTIESYLPFKLERDETIVNPPAVNTDHTGIGEQKDGNFYVGIPIERGRWTEKNMRDVADLTDKYAVGEKRIRLTGKQNVIILDVPKANLRALVNELEANGLSPQAHRLRTSLVSCTGNEFCNLAVVETKHRAGAILKWLESNVELDSDVAIHFTGCPNACSQFQIADIGLRGTGMFDPFKKDAAGKSIKIEGYSVALGGCLGSTPHFAEFIEKKVPADRVHLVIKALLEAFKAERVDEDETFHSWTQRSQPEHLQQVINGAALDPAGIPLEVPASV
jgi:sulfite reductase beta subunit-like hemoprotein